jgi:hypothetical protein
MIHSIIEPIMLRLLKVEREQKEPGQSIICSENRQPNKLRANRDGHSTISLFSVGSCSLTEE